MADLRVKELDLQNPFIIAASPATHGVKAVYPCVEPFY